MSFVCGQCSDLTNDGAVDPEDDTFYCFLCWQEYGGVPESVQRTICILCGEAKPKHAFSKTQRKRKKPICQDCIPLRKKDSRAKVVALQKFVVHSFSKKVLFAHFGDDWTCYFGENNGESHPRLRNVRRKAHAEYIVDYLIGVNNVVPGRLTYDKDLKWQVSYTKSGPPKKITDGSGYVNFDDPYNLTPIPDYAKFAISDSMRIYSLKSVVDNLTIAFIFQPNKMYDVREKYPFKKVAAFLSQVFNFPRRNLLSTDWPGHRMIEDATGCSEALSNDIVTFTGEVFLVCTFSTPFLGNLFQPWETWRADLKENGNYFKKEAVPEYLQQKDYNDGQTQETSTEVGEEQIQGVCAEVVEERTQEASSEVMAEQTQETSNEVVAEQTEEASTEVKEVVEENAI